ncbi:hypothetical protein Esi_0037_0083 [Ectocarpus siliculosus]|uniref:Uncharacterized protein n=1 Tax=Ectocarpus siliculosus TaxID=2880 RepID=D8LLN2_ECTSI|nr:hypothetical protein Esi_0037_0083 [Ectocarpus siliculosus]|eukprot:CBN74663.1 hypothetical protein Esi_0037_0083 [Ectocarpus siliculosus]
MDESTGKNSGKHKDKTRRKKPGKNAHNVHMRGKPCSSSKHPQYHKKRPHPPGERELAKKVRDAVLELKAVDRALADEGTYLGIVDKAELEKRRYILVRRRFVLREERELVQKLRVEVKKGAGAAPCDGPQHTHGLTFLSLEGCTFDRSLRPAVGLFALQFENE